MKTFIYLVYVFICTLNVQASTYESKTASDLSQLPLFSKFIFTYKDIAEAVNYCISKGEKQSTIGLIDLAWDDENIRDAENKGFSVLERSFWVASILYKPRDYREKQSGYIKGLDMPELKEKNLHFMYYPAIEIEGHYFIMASGISGAGGKTSIVEYVNWCQRFGSFRNNTIDPKVVVSEEVLNAYFGKPLWRNRFPETSVREEIQMYIKSQMSPIK
jgi:hypothetical protein